jgi:Domain of unknown function (DUF1917)
MTTTRRSTQRDQHPAPSKITEEFWVGTVAPPSSVDCGPRSGKWLVFTPPDSHDEAWDKIRAATELGELGYAAKAATALQGRVNRAGALVTCVYTYDYEDHDDVQRVLAALRGLGIEGRLSYKSDEATSQGTYGRGTAIYVSQPGSSDFEDRRRPL